MFVPADEDDADKEDVEEETTHLPRGVGEGRAAGTLDGLPRRRPLRAAAGRSRGEGPESLSAASRSWLVTLRHSASSCRRDSSALSAACLYCSAALSAREAISDASRISTVTCRSSACRSSVSRATAVCTPSRSCRKRASESCTCPCSCSWSRCRSSVRCRVALSLSASKPASLLSVSTILSACSLYSAWACAWCSASSCCRATSASSSSASPLEPPSRRSRRALTASTSPLNVAELPSMRSRRAFRASAALRASSPALHAVACASAARAAKRCSRAWIWSCKDRNVALDASCEAVRTSSAMLSTRAKQAC
mmetsp:Transcript_6337/g.17196  ORF Transcript_6337/g.17196 Transcript_6337/m.17196 type:complete len:311 (+) Transcript_6337:472-1404(+)